MKIYLDNNLGVANVEQEELTQDTIGYNILKVYIPNAVLTPYDTFTCYYGALLQNGRKVGWFAMEARTSSDADYEANYTLYKATLEQCVVSVEGKVYIGCQVLLGNSGNATLIKKNTAVVQFNVRKSVAINNDILVLDTDQTTTDVLESYKNLLENALTTYATKAEVYTKTQIDALLLQKADKATTYNKDEVNSALALKADKSDTYTKTEVNNIANGLSARITANADDIDALEGNVTTLETDIADLKSVQNVVEVVATKSALNSYDTTKLDVNDKVQVIADETHDGASTIYNWSGSAWQYVGAYGTNSYTKQETLEQIDIHKLINKTYSELATLKANNGLVAGQKYRITDYVTKTNGICNGHNDDVRSVEHPFDVIVTAISNNEFSENARAIQHTGDSYFANSKLEAWQLWYCFDNDTNRFEWADTTNGKGVIYRMIDEFQNDVPYDFKNIQFKRYVITGVTDSRQSTLIGEYLGFYENYNVTSDSTDYVWNFTFEKRSDGTDLSLVEVNSSTFNQNSYVKQVVIGEYITDNPTYRCKQALNNIVMEVDALIVDVSMGKGSHHNTWFGNEDIDYCYFASMFRQNILYGEINHTRADECFEKNVIGDGALTTYASCWNKFTHHFSRNIGINMQSNDFEGQVDETKFPLHFTRNHISNMWDEVNASSHTTFNRCEFGYVVTATFGGNGTWDGVKSIMLWNTTININNLFGTTLGRLEYVTISQGTNGYNILNLTTGALNGSSGKPLIINLSDISNLLATSYEKNITFAWHNLLNAKCLIYSVKVYDKTNNLVYDTNYAGIINTANNNVTWEEVGDIGQLKTLVNTKADTSYVNEKLEEVGQMFEIVGNEVLKKADKTELNKNYYVVISDDITDFTPLGSNEFEITLSEELENVITDFKQGIYIDWATLFPDIPYSYNVCCYVPTKKVVLDGKIHYLLSCVDSLIDSTLSFYKVDNQWKLSMIEANLVDRETLNYEVSQLTSAINGKSTVTANPTLSGDEPNLEGAEIDGIKYKVGGGGKLYLHRITLPYNSSNYYVSFEIISKKNSAYTYSEIVSWLTSLHASAGWQGGVCCSTTSMDSTIFPLGIGQDSEVFIQVYYWDGTKVARETLNNLGITVYDNYIEV